LPRRIAAWAGLCLLLGCGGKDDGDSGGPTSLTKTEYLEQYPTVYCEFLERCSPDTIADSYAGSVDECIDRMTTWGRDRLNDGCSYGGSAAAECVTLLPDANCEDWAAGVFEDSCGEIIDC